MAESVTLTKSAGFDFQIVVTGMYDYTKQFPRADYQATQYGVRLVPYVGAALMLKEYAPEEWTVGVATGFTTNKEVTDAITALANS